MTKTKMVKLVTAVFFSAAFIFILMRLPINGWGSLVWFAAGGIINLIRAPFAKDVKDNKITDQLVLVMLGGTFLPILHLITGVFSFANFQGSFWIPCAGIALLIPGLWLFWRSHADLGKNWSVTTELREDHTLVTNGVYRHIRHPMYAAILLLFLAQPFLVHNWIAGLAGPICFMPMLLLRGNYEEQMMLDKFGEQYRAYAGKTGRIFPKLVR